MRLTISIDDQLFAHAQRYAGVVQKSEVVWMALKVYVEREAGRRLAEMGGTLPKAKAPPRHRRPKGLQLE
jgi:Arc/MetJ family transcription regulator